MLLLRSLIAQPVSVRSFGTFVDFRDGKFGWLTLETTHDAVSYADALASIGAYAETLRFEDRLDLSEYGRHLGPVSDAETWIPKLKFPKVEVSPMLNCNWEWFVKASDQLNRVRCRPNFIFSRVE